MNDDIKELKNEIATVSKAVFEYEKYVKTKAVKVRDWIIAILIILLVTANVFWIVWCSQFEKVTETTETRTVIEGITQSADNSGNNTLIGGDYNGEPKNQKNNDNEEDH